MECFQISLIFALCLVIVEIYTLSFIFLGFAFGITCVAIFQFLTGVCSLGRDVIVFSIGSGFFIFVASLFFANRKDDMAIERDVNFY
jgi:membrane protein implicated in regulation of membrane protease activity